MLSIIRRGTALRRWPDPVRAREVMEQSESDHQLDLLDLGPFVLLNLQAEAETDNSVEFVRQDVNSVEIIIQDSYVRTSERKIQNRDEVGPVLNPLHRKF